MSDEKIPLFPLPGVVLFPGCFLPLHIFEPRYREMVKTAIDGDRTFGVLLMDQKEEKMAQYGCSAEIVEVRPWPDGRMDIAAIGRKRFRVIETSNELPYMTGSVEYLDDEPAAVDLAPAAQQVRGLLSDVLRLFGKLADKKVEIPNDLPPDPEELSYWVAGTIHGLVAEQQELLELGDTHRRLERESEILLDLRKELSARTALKDAFKN